MEEDREIRPKRSPWVLAVAFVRSAWGWFAFVALCLGFWADIPIEKSRMVEIFSSVLPLAGVLLHYVAFFATVYFGGRLMFRAIDAVMFIKQGGPDKEEFASYSTQIDGLIKLFRIYRAPDHQGEVDVEVEAKLRVEMDWFSKQMAVFDVWTPDIDPDVSKNVIPWVEYLVQLEMYARHKELNQAREFGREQR